MTNEEIKKEDEKRTLSKFVSNEGFGKIISSIQIRETPDFKVREWRDNRFIDIGIEMTRVFNPHLKSVEEAQKKIVERAKQKFKSLRNERLVVYVDFTNSAFSLKDDSINKLSKELFDLVNDIVSKNEGFEYRIRMKQEKLQHPNFDDLSVQNDLWYENWQPHGAFSVPYIDEEWFAEIVRNKENKIPFYNTSFEEKWLVLATNFGHQSSAFQFPQLSAEFKNSAFDNIYIYKEHENKIIKVK